MKKTFLTFLAAAILSSCLTSSPESLGFSPVPGNDLIFYSQDEFSEYTFYDHDYFLRNILEPIKISVIKIEDGTAIRLHARYSGDDWIFFDTVYLKGSDIIEFRADPERDVHRGFVTERVVIVLDDPEALLSILSGEVRYQLRGKYSESGTVSPDAVSAMRDMIQFYLDGGF